MIIHLVVITIIMIVIIIIYQVATCVLGRRLDVDRRNLKNKKIILLNNNKQLFFYDAVTIIFCTQYVAYYYIILQPTKYIIITLVGGMYIINIILSCVFMDNSKTLNRQNTGPSALLIKYVRPKTLEASVFVESLMLRNLCTLPALRKIVNFLLPIVRPCLSPLSQRYTLYIGHRELGVDLEQCNTNNRHTIILNHICVSIQTCACVHVTFDFLFNITPYQKYFW